MAMVLLLSRFEGPEYMAAFGIAVAGASLCSVIADCGLSGSTLALCQANESVGGFLRRGCTRRRLLVFFGASAAIVGIGGCLDKLALALGVVWLTVGVLAQQLARNVLIVQGRNSYDSIVTAMESMFGLGLVLTAAGAFHAPVSISVMMQALAFSAGAYCRHRASSQAAPIVENPITPISLRATWPFFWHTVFSTILTRADILLLSAFGLPLTSLAAYQIVSRCYYFLPLPFEAFAGMLVGKLRRADPADQAPLKMQVHWAVQTCAATFIAAALLPISAVLLRLASIDVALGGAFWSLMSVGLFWRLHSYAPGVVLTATGRQGLRARASAFAALVNVVAISVMLYLVAEVTVAAASLAGAELILAFVLCRASGLGVRFAAAGCAVAFLVTAATVWAVGRSGIAL